MENEVATTGRMATESGLEVHSHDYIPLEERHGKATDLFTLWFGENMTIFALVTGALAISLGLNFWWAIVAIVVGTLSGALIMAFHSAQGPILGLPQMIQSRAQFGYFGALLPTFLAWCSYIAFLAVALIICAQSFDSVFGGGVNVWMIVTAVAIWVLAIVGYDLIHLTLKYLGWAFGVFFIFLAILVVANGGVPAAKLDTGTFTIGTFMAVAAVMATWNAGYAPYVSDYSRYLPPGQTRRTFLYTYSGTTISTILLMILGAWIVALDPSVSVVDHIKALGGDTLGPILVVLMAIGLIIANSTNTYGGGITGISMLDNIRPVKSTVRLRIVATTLVSILAVLLGVIGSSDLGTFITNFFFFLLYGLIPWSMINLVDFFLIRHGHYRTDDFFNPKGSFGAFGWLALIVYGISVLCELPFVNTALYVGPAVDWLGGADIAWIVGAVVSGVLYYVVAGRRQTRSQSDAAPAAPAAGAAHSS